jgi:hypothetical protein
VITENGFNSTLRTNLLLDMIFYDIS